MKLTVEQIKKIIKEEISSALRESMMGTGAYYRREKNGDLTSLPDDSDQSVDSYNRNIQQQISELTEDGTVEVVEDMEKGRIEFFYRDEDGQMSPAGYARFDTRMEDLLDLAKAVHEFAEYYK
jgi:hypothetical protein